MLVQFRDPRLSLWQSSLDQVLHQNENQPAPSRWLPRPSLDDTGPGGALIREATRHCDALFNHHPITKLLAAATDLETRLKLNSSDSLRDQLCYCSTAYLKLAEAVLHQDSAAETFYRGEVERFGNCDPRYAAAMQNYVNYFRLAREPIPYRSWKTISDYVEELPEACTIALIGDWGTGQQPARATLERVAARGPKIVIHLGDVYYSGTQYEMNNYFLELFKSVFVSAHCEMPRVYTLSGNHDMYSGGAGYYWLLDQIRQEASFFCLKNSHWKIIGVDTGINDHDPFSVDTCRPTLRDNELAWLRDKIANAEGSRTILMSHHPLFSAYERIDGQPINDLLHNQLKDILPGVAAWYWAHEHNLVVYKEFLNVHARCIGHGAFPVAIGELGQPHSDVPFFGNVRLGQDGACYQHGYVMIQLKGEQAAADYYVCDSSGGEQLLYSEQIERLS